MNLKSSSEVLVIEPGGTEKNYWKDLWRYRELFLVLAWRDISVRYKQTIIGLVWALLRPLLTMVVFTVLFHKVAKMQSVGDAPYALMVYAGLLPWQFFSTALSDASASLIGNANLISKVYFPRLIIPTAAVVVTFVDFLIGFVILIGIMLWYQFLPSWHILTLPFFILMGFLASLGPSLYITALNVKYRDFRYIVPFIVQLGLYISPVGFSSSAIPDNWHFLYSLNPVVGVIDGFRWAILGGQSAIYMPGFILSWVLIVFFLLIGIHKFRKTEKSFSDLI
jgi:lipopolysaccharide transport system permease protein